MRNREAAHGDPTEAPSHENDPLVDLPAERAVLGAIFLDPVCAYEINGVLAAESFGDPRHGIIWTALVALMARGQAPDVQTVASELQGQCRLNAVGGAQYLGELTDDVAGTTYLGQHAEIVAERARQRSARLKLAVLAWRARDGSVTSAEIEALTNAAAVDLCGPRCDANLSSSEEVMDAVLDDLARPVEEAPGVPTPLASLNRVTGGWHDGQMIVLAARPSLGKTALAIQCVFAAADAGHGVLLCSLETKRIPIGRRMLASRATIPLEAVSRRRARTIQETGEIMRAAQGIARLPIMVDNASVQSLATIRATAYRLKAQGRLGLIVIDYLQLMATTSRPGGTREREVADVSRGIKVLAGNLCVPIIVCAQLNREVVKEKREPVLTDLRESGSLEQDADVVTFLHRDGDSDEHSPTDNLRVIVAKQRDGPTAKLPVIYRKNATRFYEAETDNPASTDYNGHGFGCDPYGYEHAGDAE